MITQSPWDGNGSRNPRPLDVDEAIIEPLGGQRVTPRGDGCCAIHSFYITHTKTNLMHTHLDELRDNHRSLVVCAQNGEDFSGKYLRIRHVTDNKFTLS